MIINASIFSFIYTLLTPPVKCVYKINILNERVLNFTPSPKYNGLELEDLSQ